MNETRMVAVDGTDALAYVILRPGSNDSGIVIEAAANGISKPYAAYALRHTAQSWDPDDSVGADVGQQLKDALAEVEELRSKLERAADPEADILIDCATCSQPAHWIDCPSGGWWAHEVHPADGHDAAAVEIDLINEIGLLGAVNGELAKENASLRAESEQRLGELLFWEFEYREAMDNYRGENWQVGQLRAELAQARAATHHEPITAEWTGQVTHSNDPAELTTIHLLDVDHPTRDVLLQISLENAEVLGSMLLDPPGPLDDDGIPLAESSTDPA